MRKRRKIFFLLTVLFLLDIVKPFDYLVNTEFIFVGLVAAALYFPFYLTVYSAFFFGYLKDCFYNTGGFFHAFELAVLVFLIQYAKRNFTAKYLREAILALAIVLHLISHALWLDSTIWPVFSLFSVNFFIHSVAVFFLIVRLLKTIYKTGA